MGSVSDLRIVGVDERNSNWERHRPRFRVYLHWSGESSTLGGTSTYDVTGADVLQVVDWAQRQAGEKRTWAVALVLDDAAEEERNPGCGRGLVWLVGMDGNDGPVDSHEEETQRRMLARRGVPVEVPPTDRMPPEVRPGPT